MDLPEYYPAGPGLFFCPYQTGVSPFMGSVRCRFRHGFTRLSDRRKASLPLLIQVVCFGLMSDSRLSLDWSFSFISRCLDPLLFEGLLFPGLFCWGCLSGGCCPWSWLSVPSAFSWSSPWGGVSDGGLRLRLFLFFFFFFQGPQRKLKVVARIFTGGLINKRLFIIAGSRRIIALLESGIAQIKGGFESYIRIFSSSYDTGKCCRWLPRIARSERRHIRDCSENGYLLGDPCPAGHRLVPPPHSVPVDKAHPAFQMPRPGLNKTRG